MNDRMAEWMFLVDVAILVALVIDVIISYRIYQRGLK